ncbi:MAG: hypothetical protein IJV48_04790 [Ruminococcus sp.]|nr:hypothetical protein [Ruminococcus sp.]
MIRTAIFDPPAWDRAEIMRYARIRGADDSYRDLIDECIREAESVLSYRVCYATEDIQRDNELICFGNIETTSQTIKKAIGNSQQVLVFAATVGAPFDRLLQRYSLLSPSKALILQAIGAERVESLCDAFCAQANRDLTVSKKRLTRRVSPGYGDIPLDMQRDIFALLDCPRKIGLTLDESLLMSPSKSVTAICGITAEEITEQAKCAECDKTDCIYRQ